MRDMVNVRRPRTNQFAEEPQLRVGRSQFNRSHGLKMTFDVSYLTPILVDEVLPGDTFTCSLNGFARVFSPLESPIMDNIEMETFFFFVPTRLVWENWEYFNGAHDDKGIQDTDYTIPILNSGAAADHDGTVTGFGYFQALMGLPDGLDSTSVDVNCLPFRCYNLIYNDWFRDQNLIDSLTVNTDNGPDTGTPYALRKSAKKHDYFTSALPYLQKGDAATLGTVAWIHSAGDHADEIGIYSDTQDAYRNLDADGTRVDISTTVGGESTALYADMTDVTINNLRESIAIQRLLEKDARGGTRYVEMIKAHFGVTSPDYRLQRPEFLGGGKSFINVSPVANTSATATEDQGELRGVGTGHIQGHGWAKSFTEHGYILGLIRARGDLSYFQGLERMWSRSTRYDFYLPVLANLGEQGILNKEIYVQNAAADDTVFAYQERWSEYRYKPSRIVGKLNPDCASALDHWHLAEDFGSLPTLNQTFIEDQTPMSRVITVTTEPDFLLDLWFNYNCARPIPVHSIPSLIAGRF